MTGTDGLIYCWRVGASHGPDRVGRSLLRGEDRLGVLARDFIGGPALHWGIEHFQGPAAGVDLVIMGEVGEPFEDAEQLLVPGSTPDLEVAGAALRAERP